MIELHKKYNLTKFIITVPSVAIKENILSSMKIAQPEHFSSVTAKIFMKFKFPA